MESIAVRGYDVWGRLGEGGMSEVWLAKHISLAIPSVLKTIRADIRDQLGRDAADERLLTEARLMARVKNPLVVRAIDAGRMDDSRSFLAEEYIDGIDLAELDRRRRTAIGVGLPLWFVAFVMQEICDGLHSAHQAGIIHRDVKPSNAFGSPDGIRLGDFGIAIVNSEAKRAQASGTVRFMAPEQFGGHAVDRRVDVWGAGATACDLRYGRPPFDTIDDILSPSVMPRMPDAQTPEEAFFQHTVRNMLAKDIDRRIPNCAVAGRRFAGLARSLTPATYNAMQIDKHTLRVGPCTLTFAVGDIADADVDSIVSSGYHSMAMRSGVGDALRVRGGDDIEVEAMKSGEQPLGSCIVTKAGKLKARHVLHAVSAWNGVSCVGRALARALLTADELGSKTIAMPALGTGAGRVPLEMCAHSMTRTLRWRALLGGMRAKEFVIYLPDEARRKIFQEVAEEALHDTETRSPAHDLGIPVELTEVRGEGATCIDAGSSSTQT